MVVLLALVFEGCLLHLVSGVVVSPLIPKFEVRLSDSLWVVHNFSSFSSSSVLSLFQVIILKMGSFRVKMVCLRTEHKV